MPLRRGWLLLLVAALLWAPLLGQLHRHSHGLAHDAGNTHAHDHQDEGDQHAEAPLTGANDFLFNHDDGSQDCRLYDQLTCADALGNLPQLALPLLLTPFLFRRLQRDAVARRAALFDARGPPALR